jgi:hypothetical protein
LENKGVKKNLKTKQIRTRGIKNSELKAKLKNNPRKKREKGDRIKGKNRTLTARVGLRV